MATTVDASKPDTVTGVDKVTQFIKPASYFLRVLTTRGPSHVLRAAQSTESISPATHPTWARQNPKFTFVNGDAVLQEGAGLLVVTGTLTSDGNGF